MKAILDSPYGYLTTPGGGKIENGRNCEVEILSTTDKCVVLFENEIETVKVPVHWLEFIEIDKPL